jgi:putative endopeptidase
MRITPVLLAFSTYFSIFAVAQSTSTKTPDPGFSLDTIDKTVDPCVDFYQYACGNWIKNTEIPADQPEWVSFIELDERNKVIEREILEKASVESASRDAVDQKIGDFYASCMDESAADAKGLDPLKPELARIAGATEKKDLIEMLAQVHADGGGALFRFYSSPDLHNADQVIAYIDQGGLTLPDRDYYIKDDPKKAEMRKRLVENVTETFMLAGQTLAQAADSAQTVLRIETALAKAQMDRTMRRDPKNRDHKMTTEQAVALGPNFALSSYFTAAGAPRFTDLNVSNPEFFKQVNDVIEREPLAAWKTYVTWHVLHAAAPWLAKPFVDVDFKLQKALTGQDEIQARWKRCIDATDNALGEALGQKYVDVTFGADGKQRMLKMVDALEVSLDQDIQGLDWMSADTKKQAKVKLDAIRNKIGYPDVWRDYSTLTIARGDLLGNVQRGNVFETKRDIAKIGKPLDRKEWGMTPPTVNAYYSGSYNEIVFPAGILQPPFFDKKMDDAVNFGGIGLVIGHELTHGFDDEGRQFDAKGDLKDWWTKSDAEEFEKRAKCVSDQYSQYTVIDDVKINGKLTLGEDLADLGGTWLAYLAWKTATKDQDLKPIDGFTPDQRFFIGMAQWACGDERAASKRMNAITDEHSPAEYRINGVVSNMPEFGKAFACRVGQPMVHSQPCRVW